MATAAESVREYQQFVAGSWTAAASGETFEDKDPFTGETVATVVYLVNSGRVQLCGNFRGARFDLEATDVTVAA